MDCNKDEAIKAKGMAEQKMQEKDFAGAYKLAMKAQQLHASVENISQMLMVCKVHCTAEQKLGGHEVDWYGILQVEQTVDEASIKKQYKKLALQLHPDKNQFPGAEAAFKLIGEAQALLLDKGKRSLHDVKRRASAHNSVPPYKYQPRGTYSTNANLGVQNNARGNFTGNNLQDQRPQQPATGHGFSRGLLSFWTVCPSCTIKQQLFIANINKIVVCSDCRNTFVACQVMPGPPPVSNSNQATFPKRKDASGPSGCDLQSKSVRNSKNEHLKSENSTKKVNGKRRRKREESSSSDRDEEVLKEEDGDSKDKVDAQGSANGTRRSTRSKQKVYYKEKLPSDDSVYMGIFSDDDGVDEVEDNSKKVKDNSESFVSQDRTGKKVSSGCEQNFKADSTSSSSSDSKHSQEPEPTSSCPDPEFNDFERLRDESCFSQGQIWALYDNFDLMPRFYARIKKVFSPGFKLEIKWLERFPDGKAESDQVRADFSAACGKFKHGETLVVESRELFSHLVIEKGGPRSTYKILPRKGEIWALFRNWEAIWKSGAVADQIDYDFAEILSDFTEAEGACVAFLDKMKGFVSLFCQTKKNIINKVRIRPDELFRFSHMVPSFQMTGEERDDVPKGSFELDPAALPATLVGVAADEKS